VSNIKVLYVYSSTEFEADSKVQTIGGGVVAPDPRHHFTLPPGIYRHDEHATIEPVVPTKPATFDRGLHIKGDAPDPPPRAQEAFRTDLPKLGPFLNGAGTEPATI
jgi:hypothetical protein